MLKKVLSLLLFALSAISLAQPTIITSLFPYYSLTQQIAGNHANVINILPAGASPHTYDPTPKDVAQIVSADLIIINGSIDEWLLELVASQAQDVVVTEIMTSIDIDAMSSSHDHDEDHDHDENHEHGDEHDDDHVHDEDEDHAHDDDEAHEHDEDAEMHDHDEHDHSGVNPHIWLNPEYMQQAVTLIADQLITIDPDNASDYQSNRDALLNDLQALDQELRDVLSPAANQPFVPFHDAWPYFAAHYNLDLIVEIEPAPGREPSPRYIAEALELIKESGAKAIFSEVQLAARPAEVVAENAGVALYTLDPVGGGADTGSYQDLLRYNAQVIAAALSQ